MAHTPLVSIILPVYNAKLHIARCIQSILAQTFTDFELIILNDGSSDNVTLPVCQMYANVDERIRLVDKDNTGVSHTRNTGIEQAAGKYLQFVDSDDYLAPDYTETLVKAAQRSDADLVIAHYYMVIPKGGASALREKSIQWAERSDMPLAQKFAEKMRELDEQEPEVRENGFLSAGVLDKKQFAMALMEYPASFYYGVMWNKLYRRDIILAHHIRCDTDISWSEDFLFNLNYIRWAERFCAIEEAGYYYLQNPTSLVHSQTMDLPEMLAMKTTLFADYRELFEDLGLYEENKLAVAKYLVAIAESTQPTSPFTELFREVKEALLESWNADEEGALPDAADRAAEKAAAKEKRKAEKEEKKLLRKAEKAEKAEQD